MSSLGISRHTGLPLQGFAHVEEHIRTLLTTGIGEVLMLRFYGFGGRGILGRENVEPDSIMRFYMFVVLAIELWEPRYRVRGLSLAGTTADGMQQGHFSAVLSGDYRPRALDGDFAVDSSRPMTI